MKAVAVYPRKADSAHLVEVPKPSVSDIPEGRGVLVRVLRVGLDGTDREINAGQYGEAPAGEDVLVLGHESLGVVEEVGPTVTELSTGDHVVARVRRSGGSLYDLIDMPDMTTETDYYEHGISRVHGFLTEYYVEEPRYLIHVPEPLADVGVLLEPVSIVEKGIVQAYDIQRRLKVWSPRRGAVLGAGTIGLLATMALRNRGIDVTTFGLDPPQHRNPQLVEAIGASYISTKDRTLHDVGTPTGGFDLVFESTGYSPIVFDAMQHLLAKNGVLVLCSITGGDRRCEVESDAVNLDFVLSNKAMVGTVNANREHFTAAVRDVAFSEAAHPGWLRRLLTHRIEGLDNFHEAFDALRTPEPIKVYIEVSPDGQRSS
jgi:threonine dehydrogenase-like Zn-dependent dehydrogenase